MRTIETKIETISGSQQECNANFAAPLNRLSNVRTGDPEFSCSCDYYDIAYCKLNLHDASRTQPHPCYSVAATLIQKLGVDTFVCDRQTTWIFRGLLVDWRLRLLSHNVEAQPSSLATSSIDTTSNTTSNATSNIIPAPNAQTYSGHSPPTADPAADPPANGSGKLLSGPFLSARIPLH